MRQQFSIDTEQEKKIDHFLDLINARDEIEKNGPRGKPIPPPSNWVDKTITTSAIVTTIAMSISAVARVNPPEFLSPVNQFFNTHFSQNALDIFPFAAAGAMGASLACALWRSNYRWKRTTFEISDEAKNADLAVYDFCLNNNLDETYKYNDTPKRWEQDHLKRYSGHSSY